MHPFIRAIVFMAGLVPATVLGQTVRGTVTDRATGAAGSGAVIMLERAVTDSMVQERGVLADGNGAYSIVAWGAGTYRISVRRIGRVPFFSEPLVLKEGEVRVIDVKMDPIRVSGGEVAILSPVKIRRATPCQANATDGERIATLWDDARTALMSSEITAQNNLVSRRLVRYVREIDMPSMTVADERLKAFDSHDIPGKPQFAACRRTRSRSWDTGACAAVARSSFTDSTPMHCCPKPLCATTVSVSMKDRRPPAAW
jgi:hypothetical protein